MRYLTSYWRRKVEAWAGVRFYTGLTPEASCGLGIFEWKGVDLGTVQKDLWEKEKVLVQFMTDHAGRDPRLKGMRVTPNVYTTTGELDRFVALLKSTGASKIYVASMTGSIPGSENATLLRIGPDPTALIR